MPQYVKELTQRSFEQCSLDDVKQFCDGVKNLPKVMKALKHLDRYGLIDKCKENCLSPARLKRAAVDTRGSDQGDITKFVTRYFPLTEISQGM